MDISSPEKPRIQFAAANGFPAESYLPFFEHLHPNYSISAMDNRGAWPARNKPPFAYGMPGFAKDLLAGLDQHESTPLIGMGHSHGAQVVALAALKQPDRFSKLVLIEPATLPNQSIDYVYRFLPRFAVHKLMPFIGRTYQRQRLWPSREAFIERYRDHPTFRLFEEQSMNAYAEAGLKQNSDGQFELVFDPAWESYIFRKIRFAWVYFNRLKHPTLLIKGANSSLLTSEAYHRFNQKLPPNVHAIELDDAHHMIPQEQTQRLANLILDWLEQG